MTFVFSVSRQALSFSFNALLVPSFKHSAPNHNPSTPQMLNSLIVDTNPKRSATAQASVNLVRCFMAAGALAVLQPVTDSIGVGWTYTILACITAFSLPLCSIEVRFGMRWRQERLRREVE